MTDANVLTGRLRPEFFPAIFGPAGDRPLDVAATRAGFEAIAGEIGKPAEEVAEGFLRIAVENMANAIKKISVQRGYDVSGYCLTVFGGAGAQHACAIADTLGMETCLIHPMASLLSAYGMGLADIRATRTQAVEAELDAREPAGGGGAARRAGVGGAGRGRGAGGGGGPDPAEAGAAPEGEGDRYRAAGGVRGPRRRCGRLSRRRTGRGSASIRARRRW